MAWWGFLMAWWGLGVRWFAADGLGAVIALPLTALWLNGAGLAWGLDGLIALAGFPDGLVGLGWPDCLGGVS